MGDSIRPKNLKKPMKLNCNFQRSGGLRKKKTLPRGGIDNFWNYTLKQMFMGRYSRCLSRFSRLTYSLHQSGLAGLLVGLRSSPGRLHCPQSLHSSTRYLRKCTHPGKHKFKYVHKAYMLYMLSTVFVLPAFLSTKSNSPNCSSQNQQSIIRDS